MFSLGIKVFLEASAAGGQDFHTWYKYSRQRLKSALFRCFFAIFRSFFRCPPGRGLIVLFSVFFAIFRYFFPLPTLLEIFLPTRLHVKYPTSENQMNAQTQGNNLIHYSQASSLLTERLKPSYHK